MKKMIVYKWTNKVNGKIYIGQTVRWLATRTRGHINSANAGSEQLIHRAIRKYGPGEFIVEELAEAQSLDGLNDLERYFIQKFNCCAPNGYNADKGGKGFHRKQSTREKLSVAMRSRWENGENFQETLEKAHAANRGKPSHNSGKKVTNTETIRKLSESHMGQVAWNKGLPCSQEVREKIKKTLAKVSKPVVSIDGCVHWPSIKECARDNKMSSTQVRRLIQRGEMFRYP